MPEVVTIAKAVGGALVTGAGVSGFIARLGATAVLSGLTSKLFGPETPPGVGLTGHQITNEGKTEYRKIGYGQMMVSGPIVFDGISGSTGENLWYVIPMLHGESDSLVEVHLDTNVIPVADIDWTPGTGGGAGSGTGEVSTAEYVGENDTAAVHIYWATGEDDQVAIGALTGSFTELDSEFRGREVTYLVIRMVRTEDTEKIWRNGEPRNIKALWKGRKVYDPRLDSTNGGSGSHRIHDSSTWEWSDNPALQVADYLQTYMSVDP